LVSRAWTLDERKSPQAKSPEQAFILFINIIKKKMNIIIKFDIITIKNDGYHLGSSLSIIAKFLNDKEYIKMFIVWHNDCSIYSQKKLEKLL